MKLLLLKLDVCNMFIDIKIRLRLIEIVNSLYSTKVFTSVLQAFLPLGITENYAEITKYPSQFQLHSNIFSTLGRIVSLIYNFS